MKIKRITKINYTSKRYDITTKISHAFFANSILVHNSLGIVFCWKNKWRIATRGSFESEQAIKGQEILDKHDLTKLDPNCTYLFEIIY